MKTIWQAATISLLTLISTVALAQSPGDVNNDGIADEIDFGLMVEAIDTQSLDPLPFARPSDLNGDLWLSMVDIKLYEEFLNGNLPQPNLNRSLGDVNGDGMVDVSDIQLVENALNGSEVTCNKACERLKLLCEKFESRDIMPKGVQKLCDGLQEDWTSSANNLTSLELIFADMDGDGTLSELDRNLIQDIVDGLINPRSVAQFNQGIIINRL